MVVPGQIDGTECCNYLIHWVFQHCSLTFVLKRSWRHPGTSLFNITNFYHQWLDASSQNFYTSHWVVLRKSVSNRAPQLLTPTLLLAIHLCFQNAKFLFTNYSTCIHVC